MTVQDCGDDPAIERPHAIAVLRTGHEGGHNTVIDSETTKLQSLRISWAATEARGIRVEGFLDALGHVS